MPMPITYSAMRMKTRTSSATSVLPVALPRVEHRPLGPHGRKAVEVVMWWGRGRRPLQCVCIPRIVARLLALSHAANEVCDEDRHRHAQYGGPHRADDVAGCELGRVVRDPALHSV